MIRIDSLLAGLCKEKQWHRRLALHKLFDTWQQVVGPEIAECAEPELIRGTVLWIRVADSVWMQQLHLQKPELIAALNRKLDTFDREGLRISDLRFQLDSGITGESPAKSAPAEAQKPQPINPARLAAFEGMVGTIQDQDIRERLLSLWQKSQQYPPERQGP